MGIDSVVEGFLSFGAFLLDGSLHPCSVVAPPSTIGSGRVLQLISTKYTLPGQMAGCKCCTLFRCSNDSSTSTLGPVQVQVQGQSSSHQKFRTPTFVDKLAEGKSHFQVEMNFNWHVSCDGYFSSSAWNVELNLRREGFHQLDFTFHEVQL